MNKFKIVLSICLALLLTAAFSSCGKNNVPEVPTVNHELEAATASTEATTKSAPDTINFKFVITANGQSNTYGIQSAAMALGEAMGGLLAGKYNDDGSFNVVTVNGIEASSTQSWQFFVNGELSDESPDMISVSDGDTIEAKLS